MFDIENRTKPLVKWAGGKSGLLLQLMAHFPQKFERYLEPFVGGGAVFFALKQRTPAVINDSNTELTTLYDVVRTEPKKLIRELGKLADKYSETFYYEVRSSRPTDPVAIAARLLFLNKTCFNGLYRENSRGDFNVSFGKRVNCPALYEIENLFSASERLKHAKVLNQDFSEVLARAKKGDLVYCDPPYEPLNSTSSFQSYTPQRFPTSAQERLRDACVEAANRGAVVFISNSTALPIRRIFAGHSIESVQAKRAINSKGSARGEIAELLIRVLPNLKSNATPIAEDSRATA